MRFCVVGLGNPGPKYFKTRHNIGFEWVDQCVKDLGCADWKEKYESLWTHIQLGHDEIHFLKPLTFMNLSGKALAAWRNKNQGDSRVLIAFDDMDIPLGRVRLRGQGSDGGHRGLRSILELNNVQVDRLRLGVGRPAGEAPIDFVLGTFDPSEMDIVKKLSCDAVRQLKVWMSEPLERAMSQLNGMDYKI